MGTVKEIRDGGLIEVEFKTRNRHRKPYRYTFQGNELEYLVKMVSVGRVGKQKWEAPNTEAYRRKFFQTKSSPVKSGSYTGGATNNIEIETSKKDTAKPVP